MGKRDPEPEPQSHDQWLADQFSSELDQLDWANMTPEEIAEAQAALQLMGEEYGEDWQIGQSIGTVPNTPWGTEGKEPHSSSEGLAPTLELRRTSVGRFCSGWYVHYPDQAWYRKVLRYAEAFPFVATDASSICSSTTSGLNKGLTLEAYIRLILIEVAKSEGLGDGTKR